MDEYDEAKNPSVSEIPVPTGTQGKTAGWDTLPCLPKGRLQGSTQLALVRSELRSSDLQDGF